MAGEDLFQNQRAAWMTRTPTAAGSVTTPPDSGDIRLSVDPTTLLLRLKDSAGTSWPLVARSNFTATAPPGVTNDTDEGYEPGSVWVDVTNDKAYVCLDKTDGAAVWIETTQTGGGLSNPMTTAYDFIRGDTGGPGDPERVALGGSNSALVSSNSKLAYTAVGTAAFAPDSLNAAVAPSASDDFTKGWRRGSRWIDTAADKEYVCLDETTGAAVWTETTGGGGGDADATMSRLIPINLLLPAFADTNWSTYSLDNTGYADAEVYSSGVQNDEISWQVALAAGTWAVDILFTKSNNRGIASIQIDDSAEGTVDFYGGSASWNNVGGVAGITIATTALYELSIKMLSKNGSSSSYFGGLNLLQMRRTA